jgi:hypothetical protein
MKSNFNHLKEVFMKSSMRNIPVIILAFLAVSAAVLSADPAGAASRVDQGMEPHQGSRVIAAGASTHPGIYKWISNRGADDDIGDERIVKFK